MILTFTGRAETESNESEKRIKCGWAQADITPEGKVQLMGQSYERITDEVRDPLMAVALCIEQNGQCVIWVSADLNMLESEFVEILGERLERKIPDFHRRSLIINATHIHTGPYTSRYTVSDMLGPLYVLDTPDECTSPEEYMNDIFLPNVEKICLEAYENRKEAGISFGLGYAPMGYCRRLTYKDKSAQMYGDSTQSDFMGPEGPSDSGIELMYIFDQNEELTGIVANVACPAQVLEHKNYLSGDYWGDFRRLASKRFGRNIFVLAQCAPAGDQSPRDLIRRGKQGADMYEAEGSQEIAGRLLEEILRQYGRAKKEICRYLVFSHKSIELDFPIRKVTGEQYKKSERALKKITDKYEDLKCMEGSDRREAAILSGIVLRYERQQKTDVYKTLIHIMRVGSCVFATNPFELFISYGLRIKARSAAFKTFTVQLTGDCGRYLPTVEAIGGGAFSTRISESLVGPEGGEILIKETLVAIEEIMEGPDEFTG